MGIRELLGILLIGLTIKLMDDFLDQELDHLLEKETRAMGLGDSSLPYSLLFFSISILLIQEKAISLFLASYIIGMHSDLQEIQPFGLKGYQESFMLLLIALFFIPPLEILTSFSIILVIQILDDFVDYYLEPFPSRKNLVRRLGKGICLICLFISLIFSFYKAPCKTLMVLFTTPIIIYYMERYPRLKGEESRWNTSI